MPWSDALYACDESWWEKNQDMWRDYEGMKFTWSVMASRRFGLRYVSGSEGEGLGKEAIHTGGGSGYMAVGLAYFLGAKEICLLGFDMQTTGGKTHWHGDHKKTSNPNSDMLRKWVDEYPPMWAGLDAVGIPLWNCTRETALTIPRKSLESVLEAV